METKYLFTSESVSEGHPDKVCDFIADSILDAHLEQDPEAHVACEVLCKDGHVVLGGEITSAAGIDTESVVRGAIREIGYIDPREKFHADGVRITNLLGEQSREIGAAVDRADDELGAGDQGLVFGFATRETAGLTPLAVTLAHRITRALAAERKSGRIPWLRPDAKSQVTIRYEGGEPTGVDTVVVSTQHTPEIGLEELRATIRDHVLPAALGDWWNDDIRLHINPSNAFTIGGPEGDCGVTGRKIIVDTYGGAARHGGGAFSGKDAKKVDRSAAYFARYVARQIVLRGIAECAEVQVAYAIGVAKPVAIHIDTRGKGDARAAEQFAARFDFRPAAIIEQLGLRQPIYRSTTNYGHFGKPELPWEK